MGASCCSKIALDQQDKPHDVTAEKFSYINKCMSPSTDDNKLSPSEQYECDVDTFFDVDISDHVAHSVDEMDGLSMNTDCNIRCKQYLITEEHLLRKQQKIDQSNDVVLPSPSRESTRLSAESRGFSRDEAVDERRVGDTSVSTKMTSTTYTSVVHAPGVVANSKTTLQQHPVKKTAEFSFSLKIPGDIKERLDTSDSSTMTTMTTTKTSTTTIQLNEHTNKADHPLTNGQDRHSIENDAKSVTSLKIIELQPVAMTTTTGKPIALISPQRSTPGRHSIRQGRRSPSPETCELYSSTGNDSGICLSTPVRCRQAESDEDEEDDVDASDIIFRLVAEQEASAESSAESSRDNKEDQMLNELWSEVEMREANIISRVTTTTPSSTDVERTDLLTGDLAELCKCRQKMKQLVETGETRVNEEAADLLNRSTSSILINSASKLNETQIHLILNNHNLSWVDICQGEKTKENQIESFTNIINLNIEDISSSASADLKEVNLSDASSLIHDHVIRTKRLRDRRLQNQQTLDAKLRGRLLKGRENVEEEDETEEEEAEYEEDDVYDKNELNMKRELFDKLSEICGQLDIVKMNHILEMYKNELNKSTNKIQITEEDATALFAKEKIIKEKLRELKLQERNRLNDKLFAKLASKKINSQMK